MTTVDQETVQWNDPAWERAGISYHTLNYWCSKGYLRPDITHPGSGYNRRWPIGEVAVAARMVRLVDAGLTLTSAAVVARAPGPVEIGPGVWVGVADLEEAAS